MSKLIAKLKSSVLAGKIKDIPRVDDTLTKKGWAADAKETGKNLATVQAALNSLYDATGAQVEKLQALIDGYKIDPVTGVKEWLFPPMELDTEYRTTERFMGKPVYTKAKRLALYETGNTYITQADFADNIDKVIGYYGYFYDEDTPDDTYVIPSEYINFAIASRSGDSQVDFIGQRSESFAFFANRLMVCLKYTKTTD